MMVRCETGRSLNSKVRYVGLFAAQLGTSKRLLMMREAMRPSEAEQRKITLNNRIPQACRKQ